MGLFFGTDGIRGKINEDLTLDIASKIGNALSMLKYKPTIVVGSDTRISNSYLSCGLACGAMKGGAKVIDVGVVPTAGIAYITKELKADYGVVISASHNSGEYNGIKVLMVKAINLATRKKRELSAVLYTKKLIRSPKLALMNKTLTFLKYTKNTW